MKRLRRRQRDGMRMDGHPYTLRFAFVLVFIFLGPIAASTVRGTWSAPLMWLSWAIAVSILILTARRLSPPHGPRKEHAHRRDRVEGT